MAGFFSSAVEKSLALRLFFAFVLPLGLLQIIANDQLNKSNIEFTQQHLETEAKDYGMLLAERLHTVVLRNANTYLDEPLSSLENHRLPLAVDAETLILSFEPLNLLRTTSIPMARLTYDVNDIVHISRCVSFTDAGCVAPNDALTTTWQLRLLTLYDTEASVYVTTWLPASEPLIKETLMMQLYPYLTALLVIIAVYSGALLLRAKLQPLNELKSAARALEKGELGYQVNTRGDDEFTELGTAFNAMSKELHGSFGFQSVIADVDEAILSGSDLKAVFAQCWVALSKYCGANEAIFVETQTERWHIYRFSGDNPVQDDVRFREPQVEDYFEDGQSFPILYDQTVAGWLFVDTFNPAAEARILEIIRKVSVGVINLKRSEALYHQANYDELTGLLNRTSFSFQLSKKIARVSRTENSGVLVFLDLDGFKKVNDSEGHSAGDQLLKIIADRLAGNVREEDIVARFGGDEFAIAIDAFANKVELVKFLKRLITDIEKPIRTGKLEVPIKASIGVCVFPEDGDTVEGLLKNADIAMYRAKRDSGSSFMFYDKTLNTEAERQLLVEAKLAKAIENNQIEVYLQPKLDLRTGLISSSEALSRWVDDDLGIVPPDEFIPIAERTGLIDALTRNLFVNIGALMREEADCLQQVAINISPQELDRPDFANTVIDMLRKTGVEHSRIELEVTERNFMDNPQKIADILDTFRRAGISVSLDDFGTGYSSLNLLRQLPLDYLKIDKSFIDEIIDHPSARGLVQKIIEIAHIMDVGVIAEGVETQEQLKLLEQMSCSYVQGYLIAKPLPALEAIRFIESWNQRATQRPVATVQ